MLRLALGLASLALSSSKEDEARDAGLAIAVYLLFKGARELKEQNG